jgi:hypothetical protein
MEVTNKCTISFVSLFCANSLLHLSALLGHPQGDFNQPRARTHARTHARKLQEWTNKKTIYRGDIVYYLRISLRMAQKGRNM